MALMCQRHYSFSLSGIFMIRSGKIGIILNYQKFKLSHQKKKNSRRRTYIHSMKLKRCKKSLWCFSIVLHINFVLHIVLRGQTWNSHGQNKVLRYIVQWLWIFYIDMLHDVSWKKKKKFKCHNHFSLELALATVFTY